MPLGGISSLVAKDAANVHAMGKWSVDLPSDAPEFSSTATAKGKARVAGNSDWSGSVEAYGHTPVIKPGDAFAFHGSLEGVNGISGNVIASGVAINIAQEGGEPIKHVISFEGNGVPTLGAEAGVADAVVQTPYSPLELPVKWTAIETATPVEVTLADVRSVALSISRVLHPYASSSTAKVKKRIAGPWDSEATVAFYVTDPALIPVRGLMYTLKLYATASTYWDINYAILQDISGIEVDRETGAIIACTLKFMFSSVGMVGAAPGTPTAGYIKAPGAVSWFP